MLERSDGLPVLVRAGRVAGGRSRGREQPVKERAAIVLREIEGLSTAEVAEALGSSEVTVRSQISKAMVKLRGILNREDI